MNQKTKNALIDDIAKAVATVKVSGSLPKHGFIPRSYCDHYGIKYPSEVARVTPNGLYVEFNLDGFDPEPHKSLYDQAGNSF